MTAKLSDVIINNAINDYIAGVSPDNIIAKYEIGRTTFYRWLRRKGVDRNYGFIDLPIDSIINDYLSGESENALAAKHKTSRKTIRKRLLDSGITLRNQTEANRLLAIQTPKEEHLRRIKIAQDHVRGSTRTFESLCNGAIGRERSQSNISDAERLLSHWIQERGLPLILQKAIGPYNADLAAYPVAVEIFGGNWHAYGSHLSRFEKRSNYILDSGWSLLIIWVNKNSGPIIPAAADYVITYFEEVRRDPSLLGKYRMIWGNGQVIPADSDYVANRAIVKALGTSSNRRT